MTETKPTPDGVLTDNADLAAAVGRVAMESALQEDLLRTILIFLAGEDAWLLFQGQSADWLIQTCKVILEDVDPYYNRWVKAYHDEFYSLLREADSLRKLRNAIVHGRWSDDPFCDPEDIVPRPWGNWDNAAIHYCLRSRLRRGFESRAFTISDVVRLSEEICSNTLTLAEQVKTMRRAWIGVE